MRGFGLIVDGSNGTALEVAQVSSAPLPISEPKNSESVVHLHLPPCYQDLRPHQLRKDDIG